MKKDSIFESVAFATAPIEIQDQRDVALILNKMKADGFTEGRAKDGTFGFNEPSIDCIVLAERTEYGAKLLHVQHGESKMENSIQSLGWLRKEFYLENGINLELLHGSNKNIDNAKNVEAALAVFNEGRHYNRLQIVRENMSDIVEARTEMGDIEFKFKGNELQICKINNIQLSYDNLELLIEALSNSVI